MARRSIQSPRNGNGNGKELPWLFFNVGLDYPDDLEKVKLAVRGLAEIVLSEWPASLKPAGSIFRLEFY